MRVDLYRNIHKAQRLHLFAFGERLGRADLTDPTEQATIAADLRALVDALHDHAEEERLQDTILWPRYSDAGLGDVFARFQAERRPDDARHDLVFMLPAMSIPELVSIYAGIRRSAPPDAWGAAAQLARDMLGAARWDAVASRLPGE